MKSILAVVLLAQAAAQAAPQRTFLLSNASRDLDEFRGFAKLASRLKQYGKVQVDIGVLASPRSHEMPEGGSPWHEYASYTSTPWSFFPHPKIAPYVPADWVAQNRQLLLAKAAVLRELGLEAAFSAKETFFLPEAYFQEHPEMRGPRVDHPRRSRREAFSWCVDRPETLEMIEWMFAELKRNVPEIQTIITGTNDAGAGLCWAAALYSGPNGPQGCRGRGAGVRVRELMQAIHRGAQKGGGPVTVRIRSANFWQNEEDLIVPLLPANTYRDGRDGGLLQIGGLINEAYPVRGLLNPLRMLATLERLENPKVQTISIGNTAMYSRADDLLASIEKELDILEGFLREPARGLRARLLRLHSLSGRWGGEANAEKLFEAFYSLDEALRLKQAAAPRYSNFYAGVSMRHLTRPLVIRPDLLQPDEESYYLPYVFNIHVSEAREDYIDLHGGRMTGPPDDSGLRSALAAASSAAAAFDSVEEAPEAAWLRQLALGLRMWVCEVRSIHNFYAAQQIRDRNREALSGPPRIPEKVPTWTGHPDFLSWSEIQRAELENASELIRLLEGGGLSLIARAPDPKLEDTFLLGPDLVGALKRKTEIMRRHWLDAERYLAPPHK